MNRNFPISLKAPQTDVNQGSSVSVDAYLASEHKQVPMDRTPHGCEELCRAADSSAWAYSEQRLRPF